MKDTKLDRSSKILVIGTSGSGKTTLAEKLSKSLGIKNIELDALFWKENWTQSSAEEFREKIVESIKDTQGYVIHGNYNKVKDLTWANVDTVIWLNYSRVVVMWRWTSPEFIDKFNDQPELAQSQQGSSYLKWNDGVFDCKILQCSQRCRLEPALGLSRLCS
jgi:adenylate kinase family enzyme